jgi:hypothetical protein
MPLLQFAPFASLVQPAFWHALTQLKIDVLRLSDEPLPIAAAYAPGRMIKDRETGADVALGCHLSVGGEAFDKRDAQCVSRLLSSHTSTNVRQNAHRKRSGSRRVQELQHN